MEKFYSIKEASKALGVHIETLRRWDRSGKLKAQRIGNSGYRKYSSRLIEKVKNSDLLKISESDSSFPSTPYADRLIDFNSSIIPDDGYFTKIVAVVAEFVEHLVDCEIVDGPYDKKRDIIGYEKGRYNKKKLVYIQSKRKKDISPEFLNRELDGIYTNIASGKIDSPSKIIFALSLDLNASDRDTVKGYCKQLFGEKVSLVFWCSKELNQKVKSDSRVMQTYIMPGTIDLISKYGILKSETKEIISARKNPKDITTVSDEEGKRKDLDKKIKRTAQLIGLKQFEDAKVNLLELTGLIPKDSEHSKERARVFNNLGICFKDNVANRDYNKAIFYFEQALNEDPDMWKASCNLALTYLKKNEEGDKEKAWNHIQPVWEKHKLLDPLVFLTYLDTFDARFGSEQTIKEAEKVKAEFSGDKYKTIFDHIGFKFFIGTLLINLKRFSEAETYFDEILKGDPLDVDGLYFKSLAKLGKVQLEHKFSASDLMPIFENAKEVEEAANTLTKAYEIAFQNKRYDVLPEIYHGWNVCKLWLWRNRGKVLEDLHYPPPDKLEFEKFAIIKIQEELDQKDFEGAYLKLKQFLEDKDVIPQEWHKLARLFFQNGSPEIALRLFNQLEKTYEGRLTSSFWLDKSLAEVLVDNKFGAIQAGLNARKIAKEESKEDLRVSISHYGALLARDIKEGDRLLENMLEYDKEFPEANAVIKLNIEDKKDKEFIINNATSYRTWFEGIVETYRKNSLPVYSLEKPFKRPFVELWAGRGVNFAWDYMIPGVEFEQALIETLINSEYLIFDYLSLLTLSKANLLGYLHRLNKKLFVHFKTFEKIQQELVQFENPYLRKLWNYLRSSNDITFYHAKTDLNQDLSKLSKMLDPWLLQTLQLSKDKGYTLVIDDLRLLKAVKNSGIQSINSFILLKLFLQKGWFDQKSYSQALGEIADCVYTFLPFSGDDLHEIIWLDDYKLSKGSAHLIHQLQLPGSDPISFLKVFIEFINRLWSSGALAEDKVFWLKFITEEVSLLLKQWIENNEPIDSVKHETMNMFGDMWGCAIEVAQLDDLYLLESDIELVFSKFFGDESKSKMISESISKHIKLRKEVLITRKRKKK